MKIFSKSALILILLASSVLFYGCTTFTPGKLAKQTDNVICKYVDNPGKYGFSDTETNRLLLAEEMKKRGIEDCGIGLTKKICRDYGFVEGTDLFTQCVLRNTYEVWLWG